LACSGENPGEAHGGVSSFVPEDSPMHQPYLPNRGCHARPSTGAQPRAREASSSRRRPFHNRMRGLPSSATAHWRAIFERLFMRRLFVGGAATALAMAGVVGPAAADTDEITLTLLGTSDTHGHIFNWDYFENEPYTDDEDVLGFTRVATYVDDVREEVGDDSVILMDSGDSLQGTPLTYYYGMGDGAD